MKYKLLRLSLLSIFAMLWGTVFAADYYEKVTASADITSGDYLIVYESGNVAFDGSQSTLDAVSNTIAVTIADGKIESSTTVDAATFTIDTTNGTIKSASGQYIGVSSNSNGLKMSDAAATYTNSFSIDDNGDAVIAAVFEGSTMTLRYNKSSGQTRFRYYKSGQEAIQLYKKVSGGTEDTRATTTIELGEATTSAEVGATIALPSFTVKAGETAIDGATVEWTSSNETVATIEDGQINALAAGTTTITATYAGDETYYKGSTASYTLTVTEAPYTSIAAMLADITSTKTTVSYKFEELLVTYANKTNTFVSDGQNAFMFYGDNLGLKAGDKITGTATGSLYTYNGLPEMSVTAIGINATVVSENNEVTWSAIAPADIQDNLNAPVIINDAVYVSVDKKQLTFKVGETEFIVFNQWNTDIATLETDKAYTLKGIASVYSKNETTTYQLYLVSFEEKTDEPAGFRDIKIDFTQHSELATGSEVYITVAEDGTIGTTDDATKAAATIKASAHGSYGTSNFTASVPVEGCVKITYATHDYGNDITVTNSESTEVAKFNTMGDKWMSNHDNVVVAYYRTNEPTTLNFSNANYNPYFAVEAIDEADLPTEITNYAITFAVGEGVTGVAPAAIEVEAGSKFTAPVNNTLYKEGYTLTGWESGDAIYLPGQEITPETDMTLTARFAENEVNLADRTEPVSIAFNLSGYNDNPKYNFQGNSGIIVTQATVGGKAIDVKADVDATSGKFAYNGSGWHQVNTGTKVTVPSAKGATITVKTYNNDNALKFGETAAEAAADPASFTATADDATLVIEQTGNGYWNALTITLPVPEEEPTAFFSWEGKEGGAIVSGGTVTAADKDGADITETSVNIQSGSFFVIKIDGKKDFTSGNVVTITLDNELKGGEKIVITAFRNKDAEGKKSGLLAKFDKGGQINTATTGFEFVNINEAVKETSEYAAEPNTLEYEVPATAAGSKVISMTRAETATNLWISKFVIISKESGDDPGDDPEEPVVDPVVLTWDYTEANIPTTGPDNDLYYGAYVNDAAGTNNGLHGVKLNGSGYAFFEKPAVAGTLTLTFGDRKKAGAYAVNVYSCTIADGVATKGELIGEVAIDATPGTGSIDIDKSVTGIYIERKTSSEGVLSKIVFKQFVPRTFVDFEITNAQLSGEFDATTLPKGVTFTGTQRGDSHGYGNVTLVVPVDGTVKFTIGGCRYANPTTCKVTNAEGTLLAEPNLKTATCYHEDGAAATYIYVGGPTTLTFSNIGYLPYFKAEATEVSEAIITYKDQNGKELGKKTVYEGDPIGEVPAEYETQLTIPEGMKFRGWTYSNNIKVKATDIVNSDITVKASVTAIEEAPTVGSIQTYDLTQATFYPEDHENFSVENGVYYNNHGFDFAAGGSFTVAVTGKAQIVLTLCQYGNGTTIQVVDAEEKVVRDDVPAKAEVDGGTAVVNYEGTAGLLKFTFATQTYLHKVTVYNVSDFLTKDESGYYIVPAGDAAGLVFSLNTAASEENAKIFLPNGTYDLGEATLTAISGKNVSLIGQSMEGVTIKNAPAIEMEGLGKADLFNNTAEGLYIQDLTLQNALDYYKAGTGRAATLHDQGTKTVNKNVRHLSYQDTYYSHKVGGLYYFEGGEIHGTVDYLCGNGKVYFNEVKMINEKRSSATITANSELYVFNNCTVENNADSYNFGRAWSDNPVCIWLNTTLLDPSKLVSTRWNLSGINCDYSIAGEYGTMDAAGTDITPDKNEVTFTKQSTKLNTILSADQAATYTIDYVLGDWAATAQAEAQQVEAPAAQFENGNIVWEAVDGATAYAIFKNDVLVAITTQTSLLADDNVNELYTIRSANARGGFGAAAEITGKATCINALKVENDKQVIYNMQGMRVQKANKGLYIIDGKKVIK